MKFRYLFTVLFLSLSIGSCQYDANTKEDVQNSAATNLLADVKAQNEDGTINAIIEIPAGTLEKFELNKSSGKIERDSTNGKPRTIDYLGYPANYGLIPQTLLSKQEGGDGDPLDVLVLGPSATRGEVVECKLIGVLRLKDRGEQDDKLIAVANGSLMHGVSNIDGITSEYEGALEIIEIWFTNYKGPGKMLSEGYGNKDEAETILRKAREAYKREN